MQMNGCGDVNGIDVVVRDQIAIRRIRSFDAELIAKLAKSRFAAAAGGQKLAVRIVQNRLTHTFSDDVSTTEDSPMNSHPMLPN